MVAIPHEFNDDECEGERLYLKTTCWRCGKYITVEIKRRKDHTLIGIHNRY